MPEMADRCSTPSPLMAGAVFLIRRTALIVRSGLNRAIRGVERQGMAGLIPNGRV
jgi:hypothetical protein